MQEGRLTENPLICIPFLIYSSSEDIKRAEIALSAIKSKCFVLSVRRSRLGRKHQRKTQFIVILIISN